MKKYLIFFGLIFICAIVFLWKKDRDADDMVEYDDFEEVIDHYNQILVKKWQENTNQRALAEDPYNSLQNPWKDGDLASDNALRTAEKLLKEYYNLTHLYRGGANGFLLENCSGSVRYAEGNWLVRYLRHLNSSKQEQIWFLISGTNGKFLSTYKDTIRIAKKNKREIREEERREQEKEREYYVNFYYNELWVDWKFYLKQYDSAAVCPTLPLFIFYGFFPGEKVNSAHIQKSDSVYRGKCKDEVCGVISKYGFSGGNKNIDSVTAIKITVAAAAECYGSEMTPFMAMLMGNNREHWVGYCFPTIPDNINLQKRCYNLRISQYEEGKKFSNTLGCPVVFTVLISRENGQVLAINVIK